MFAICIESSHKKGMGHLFRAINLVEFLKEKKQDFIVCINNNEVAKSILNEKNIPFEIVDLFDFDSNWEKEIIEKYNVDVWINDRLDTDLRHSNNVITCGCKLVTFDDLGEGAKLADLNFSPLLKATGSKKNFNSVEYLVLNKEIDKYKYQRTKCSNIVVTLGGSDTYGVTIKVAQFLKKLNKMATIIIGPSFEYKKELEQYKDFFEIKQRVPSLIEEFSHYDLAITGGGITPFEANASGLPCIIIANEKWEIDNAKILTNIGSSVFAGFYTEVDESIFKSNFDYAKMSKAGLENLSTNAVELIFEEIRKLCQKQ